MLDWGIGGVGVLRAMRSVAPDVDVVYLSDSGATPYGKLSRDALRRRVARAIAHLVAEGATEVVVACNAASTVLDDVRGLGDEVPVTGMIAPATRAMSERVGVIGVVGGARTIRSGVYARALAREGVVVRQRIAQPLSAHIEAGTARTAACEAALDAITRPLRGVDALLLACTHYPAITDLFVARLPGTHIVDPADAVARSVVARTTRRGRGELRVCTTGDAHAMGSAAERAFGVILTGIRPVTLR